MSDIDKTKIRRLDGGLLLVFRELMLRRRATEAAERLGLSSSAVSHALARLRDLLDDQLFIRRPHGLEPTRRALQLAPQIEALIELADTTLRKPAKFDPRVTQRHFQVAAPDFFIALVGARLVEQLRAEAPGAAVVLVNQSPNASYEALKRGETDLAVGRLGAARAGFITEKLYEDRFCVIARSGHPKFRRKITPEQYRNAGHIFSQSPGEGGEADEARHAAHIRYHAVVPRWLTVLTMVAASDAIGTVPRRLAERHADVLGLRILDAPFVGLPLSVSVVRRAGRTDEGLDWFLEHVKRATR